MAILPVTADNIGSINGGSARLLIDKEIQKAVDDLFDRAPEDGKCRKVAMIIELELLDHEQVDVRISAQAKLPPGRTGINIAKAKASTDGQQKLVFQAFAPDDPDQSTLRILDNDK